LKQKFGRTYEIQIKNPQGELITIKPPFSIHFDLTRNVMASVNNCTLIIYNLAEKTRNRIFKDRYTTFEYWQMIIRAGYGRLCTVFQGNIYESKSWKEGTEWITHIDAYDGMYAIQNGHVAMAVSAGTQKPKILDGLIGSLDGIIKGFIGSPGQGTTERAQAILGPSIEAIAEQVDNQYFFDNETINVLSDDEVISGPVLVLDSNQLFSTPKIRETFFDCDTLFFPEARVGLITEIHSREKKFDGQYKTLGFSHSVDILSSSGGEARTSWQIYKGPAALQEVSL
jgi:hypothetical protein